MCLRCGENGSCWKFIAVKEHVHELSWPSFRHSWFCRSHNEASLTETLAARELHGTLNNCWHRRWARSLNTSGTTLALSMKCWLRLLKHRAVESCSPAVGVVYCIDIKRKSLHFLDVIQSFVMLAGMMMMTNFVARCRRDIQSRVQFIFATTLTKLYDVPIQKIAWRICHVHVIAWMATSSSW